MYILLERGVDTRRKGDEMACSAETWYNPCEETWELWDKGLINNTVRRKVESLPQEGAKELADRIIKKSVETYGVALREHVEVAGWLYEGRGDNQEVGEKTLCLLGEKKVPLCVDCKNYREFEYRHICDRVSEKRFDPVVGVVGGDESFKCERERKGGFSGNRCGYEGRYFQQKEIK